MSFEGTIQNGTVVFDESPSLPEGTRVEVVAKAEPVQAVGGKFDWLIGAITDMPADFAAEHDHYIHGTPRRNPKVDE